MICVSKIVQYYLNDDISILVIGFTYNEWLNTKNSNVFSFICAIALYLNALWCDIILMTFCYQDIAFDKSIRLHIVYLVFFFFDIIF